MMIEVTIRFFGAFRGLAGGDQLAVSIPAHSSLGELRELLPTFLPAVPEARLKALLRSSAWADERRILSDEDRLCAGMALAILPPVCGG